MASKKVKKSISYKEPVMETFKCVYVSSFTDPDAYTLKASKWFVFKDEGSNELYKFRYNQVIGYAPRFKKGYYFIIEAKDGRVYSVEGMYERVYFAGGNKIVRVVLESGVETWVNRSKYRVKRKVKVGV